MATTIKGKSFVITGAAEGIGYEYAKHFLDKQAKLIIILDINEEKGVASVSELNSKYGNGKAVFIKCDVTKDLDEVTNKILNEYKNIDVLINNAGVVKEDSVEIATNINFIAVLNFTYKFWEHMRKDKGGRGGTIINISSIFGYRPSAFVPIYTGTKFGVLGFSKALGHEYNYKMTGVRIVTLCPGLTHTALTSNYTTREPELTLADSNNIGKLAEWQEAENIGKGAVEVFEKAESGSAWLIEGGRSPEEI